MTLARILLTSAVALAGAARAEPAPAAPPELPSMGVLACSECAGVMLAGVPVRGEPGRPTPTCGLTSAAVELRGGAGTIPSGVPVAILSSTSVWLRVRAPSGEAGYAPASGGVTLGPSDGCAPLPASPVPLRRSANPAAPIVAELEPGTPVGFGATSAPGWLRVRGPGGEEGFVPAALVAGEGVVSEGRRDGHGQLGIKLGFLSQTSGAFEGWSRALPVELSVAASPSDHVRLEASLSWYSISASAAPALGPAGATDGSLRLAPLMGRLRLVAPVDGAEVSAALGLGVGLLSWRATPPPDPIWEPAVEQHRSASVLLADVGLGVAVPLGRGARLGIELRYVVGRARVLGADVGLDAVVGLAGMTWDL